MTRSTLCSADETSIRIRGLDLSNDILGNLDLGGIAHLEMFGTVPDPNRARIFNALCVCLVEHGLTPSVIAARMTFLGAPEAMQAAVGAGLAGLGSAFVGTTQSMATLLRDALAEGRNACDIVSHAQETVNRHSTLTPYRRPILTPFA